MSMTDVNPYQAPPDEHDEAPPPRFPWISTLANIVTLWFVYGLVAVISVVRHGDTPFVPAVVLVVMTAIGLFVPHLLGAPVAIVVQMFRGDRPFRAAYFGTVICFNLLTMFFWIWSGSRLIIR